MLATMTQFLQGITTLKTRQAVRGPLEPLVDRSSTQPLRTAGLVIKTGGSTLAKIGAADFYASVKGTMVTIAAATDMPALTGLTITATKFNVACFFVDSASAVTVAFGTEGAALGNVVFPPFPLNKALIGFLLITYASTFTGGTTALDTATTQYFNGQAGFDPSVLV